MALAAIAVFGIIAYTRLPAELNPRVDIPTLTVTTVYPGAGPREIETLVTRPLEDAVGAVNNVRDVYSSSQDSVSILSMDFRVGTDIERALADVRARVESALPQLPAEAHAPVVAKLDINAQPILYVGLTSEAPLADLKQAVDTSLKPRLARVDGVATVTVVGGVRREARVAVDARSLERHGLTVRDVSQAVEAANRSVPAGAIARGDRRLDVRTIGAIESLEEVCAAQILAPHLLMGANPLAPPRKGPAPPPLTVGDVAAVYETTAEPETLTRVNGRESVGLVLTKTADSNTVRVANEVKAELARALHALPAGTKTVTSRDESIVVHDALEDVNVTLLLGAVLATLVVYLFLRNLRGTVIVALALPACIVATYLALYVMGFTLNQMTLLALSLSVGILVDDSIVVLESITRHLGMGEDPEDAAFNGRTEIGFADVTTTLVDVVVFVPIAFMGGIVGAFFREFGATVAFATLFSLLVSFTVTPALAARWYRKGEDPDRHDSGASGALERVYLAVERGYRGLLARALRNRGWVVAAAAVFLVSGFLVTLPHIGTDLLPATDQGQITITVELPPDASLAATDAAAREVERVVAKTPDVRSMVTTVGEILGGFGAIPQRGAQVAQLNVRLTERAGVWERLTHFGSAPAGMRAREDHAVAEALRRGLRNVPNARVEVTTVRSAASMGAPVQVRLRGADLERLTAVSSELVRRMGEIPELLGPNASLRAGRPEAQVRVDRVRAAAVGVPIALAGAALRESLEGNAEAVLRRAGEELPIRVQLAEVDRGDPADLRRVPVGFHDGRSVLLGEVAEITMASGPSAIDRLNGQRMVTVTANLPPDVPLGRAQTEVRRLLERIPREGVSWEFGGEAATMDENIPYFAFSLGLAVILVYLVMASLFNSLLNPFIIMFTLPMALVGALAGLALTGETLSLASMIGIIMLTGLMGRNAILLIDYTGTLRARGMERERAVVEGAATRLRPILMTTLATVFGMLPVALRIGRAAELRAPMAIVVIGGLLVSTLLTLVVIPALYTLFDDLLNHRARGPVPAGEPPGRNEQ
jgi:HAE1 family hydrophobic/amphiphilic exporter-1